MDERYNMSSSLFHFVLKPTTYLSIANGDEEIVISQMIHKRLTFAGIGIWEGCFRNFVVKKGDIRIFS